MRTIKKGNQLTAESRGEGAEGRVKKKCFEFHYKLRLKWVTISLFLLFSGNAFSQSYNYRNFSTEDGLPQAYIYSLMQDVNGYLWIGTGNGLSRYNGFMFENYTTSDSLAENPVNCGISDGESLWFGHNNGRISFFNGKKFSALNIPDTIVSPVTHFAKSPDGNIWAGTYADGLLKMSKDSGSVKRYVFKNSIDVLTFIFLNDNELLVATNSGLLYCRLIEPGSIEIVRPVSEIPESKVTCLRKMRNKPGFYVATENDGVFQLIPDNNLFKISKIKVNCDFDLTGIQAIYEDNQLNLWLGSFGNGLIKLTASASGEFTKCMLLNVANRFVTDNVKTVYEDREGNIWSGNYGKGLTQITPKTFTVNKFDNPLYGNDIFSICLTRNYRWIGTENGFIKTEELTGKVVKFYSKGSGLPKDTVTTIYSKEGKELWIGTSKNGVFRMDTESDEILKYQIGTGTLENAITIITGKGEQVWIGTKIGLCSVNSVTNQKEWFTISKGGLPHNLINGLYIDKTDKLWITTRSNTLSYIQGGKVFKVPFNSGSGTSTLGPITEDSDSRIWLGSNGSGVFMIESDSIINLTVKEGLFSNYCYSILCDDHNNIWIGHKGGLSKIRISDFSVKPVQHIESITDSYQFNPNAIIRDRQDRIWFGSDKGIVSYDPSMEYASFLPPELVITSIKINDEEKDISDKIVLSPGNYKIRIDFLGISLREPTLVTYQYKLEGYDQWSEVTKSTFMTCNLTDGVYKFILKASSGDGAVTENPLTLNIVIKVPVWKKWWFYVVTSFVLLSLIIIYIKRREYQFLAEKRILEEKVIERTQEIQAQKNEIELQRDQIDEKNESITSSIRYASHIQNAILPPFELIDELLPDHFILSRPKDIVSGDFYWLAEKNDKIIFTVADCTGHGVPGAFMSFLGITLLNSIVNLQGNTQSDSIVTMLRDGVTLSLQQGRKDIPTSDGMDIALCVLDLKQRKIQYTGGMNNLVYIRDGKVEVVKANRFSVCAANKDTDIFTMNIIDVKEGDVFYLFSDGYKDQFGGDFDKKFLSAHFYLTLLEIHKLPMPEQKEILESKLVAWMKDTEQTDDVTVMGVRL